MRPQAAASGRQRSQVAKVAVRMRDLYDLQQPTRCFRCACVHYEVACRFAAQAQCFRGDRFEVSSLAGVCASGMFAGLVAIGSFWRA